MPSNRAPRHVLEIHLKNPDLEEVVTIFEQLKERVKAHGDEFESRAFCENAYLSVHGDNFAVLGNIKADLEALGISVRLASNE